MARWGRRRGLSPLPAFGRTKFDTESRRVFDEIKRAERAAASTAAATADLPTEVPLFEPIPGVVQAVTLEPGQLIRVAPGVYIQGVGGWQGHHVDVAPAPAEHPPEPEPA